MGRNKHIRDAIEGHERNIWKHHLKIEDELGKDSPDEDILRKWRQDIKRADARIEFLKRRLGRRRNAARKKSPA